MTQIRYATESDLDALVELASQEHAMSPWADLPFEPEQVRATMLSFITGHGRTMLMTDGGYFAGLVQPMGFVRRLMAIEYAWFAIDGQGLALLRRFEEWARNMGAFGVTVHNYTGDQSLERVLTRRDGYQCLGQAMFRAMH